MPTPRLVTLALIIVLLAVALLGAAGVGYRQNLWTLPTAFAMIKWAAYLGIAGGILALLVMTVTRRVGRATLVLAVAFVVAAGTAWLPWSWKQRVGRVPPIHDVTTDTQDPPRFVAILPLRADAKNPATYGGDSVATLQRAGYPDIAPLHLALPPAAAFARARMAATEMGWVMVAADSADGRIEATATTRWFGFKDDVVIRVRPDGAGSLVDVRSVSRIGGSDVGTNAARIRAFVARVR